MDERIFEHINNLKYIFDKHLIVDMCQESCFRGKEYSLATVCASKKDCICPLDNLKLNKKDQYPALEPDCSWLPSQCCHLQFGITDNCNVFWHCSATFKCDGLSSNGAT